MSKLMTTLAVIAGLIAASAFAANDDHAGHHGAPTAAATAETPMTMSEGTVRKVDKAGGKVTIAHGPLENLNMPPMTMVFRVSSAALLDDVEAGDKIRFTADRVSGTFTVTALEVAE